MSGTCANVSRAKHFIVTPCPAVHCTIRPAFPLFGLRHYLVGATQKGAASWPSANV